MKQATYEVSPVQAKQMKAFGGPKPSAWGENPLLQCNICLEQNGIAEWSDKLYLVWYRRREVLACEAHKSDYRRIYVSAF